MQRMILQVNHVHLVGQWSSPAKRPHEVRATVLSALLVLALCFTARAQVNSGSDGSDGAFNPTKNIVIDMHDHTTGVYNYTSVNIPSGVTATFIPNANNTPVTWLVQSNVVINGTVDVSGQSSTGQVGAAGGPGGWSGGSGGSNPSQGQGPGGGGPASTGFAAGGSYGTQAEFSPPQVRIGPTYGNSFLLPLLGGSGGGGSGLQSFSVGGGGGGGGGGAILIASQNYIQLNGKIVATGGQDGYYWVNGVIAGSGSGSGGAIRLVAVSVTGFGTIDAGNYSPSGTGVGGEGRIRIDAFQNTFGGSLSGVVSEGFQPIIIPAAGQGVQLVIASVGGTSVSPNPTGQLVSPDAIISGQQANPIPVVVNCSNLPLNTPVTVTVTPANGSAVSAVGYNNTGTLASSTATVSLVMPRGGGIIYATATTGN
jgi:hypothetical protein